jgi:hypothetical protein
MQARTENVEYLVLDVDNCSLVDAVQDSLGKIIPNAHEDLLSPHVIAEGRSGRYAGFYLCTWRCARTTFQATFSDRVLNNYKANLKNDYDPRKLLTTSVAENLEKVLGIPCIAISTPDDLSETAPAEQAKKCGYGYQNLIRPLEQKLIAINQDLLNKPCYSGYTDIPVVSTIQHQPLWDGSLAKTKNPQLKQIASHASAHNPNKKVKLAYWDDEERHCTNASKLGLDELPNNVLLQITQLLNQSNLSRPIASIQGAGIPPSALSPVSTLTSPLNSSALIYNKTGIDLNRVNFREEKTVLTKEFDLDDFEEISFAIEVKEPENNEMKTNLAL